MLIDLYIDATVDSDASLSDETRRQISQNGIEGLVLVGENKLPNVPNLEGGIATSDSIQIYSGAVLDIGEARLWTMPPSADHEIPEDLGTDPAAAAQMLADSGWAVLVCNPYARELPGGELRDKAINLSSVHGFLSLTAAAPFEENLLAQELAMAQRKVAAAGTGMPVNHPEFGRYFTLTIPEIATQEDLVRAIREGQILPVESSNGSFAPVEAPMRPRSENRRDRPDRKGSRDRNRQRRPRNDQRGPRNHDNNTQTDNSAGE